MEQVSMEMKKGPWSPDEDSKLIHSISLFGQGLWDSLAHVAGRGKITPQEQLLILHLHFRFGNRWSAITMLRITGELKSKSMQKSFITKSIANNFDTSFSINAWMPSLLAQQIPSSSSSSSLSSSEIILTENYSPNNINTCPNVNVISSSTDSFVTEDDV